MAKTVYFWDPIEDNVAQSTKDSDEVVGYNTEPHEFGQILSVQKNGDDLFLHTDAIGSVIAATDNLQNIQGKWSYSAFGERTEHTTSFPAECGYCGRYGYMSSSAISVRRRTYDPILCRWLSIDPIAFQSSVNLFLYAANNPTMAIDPSGLQEIMPPDPVPNCMEAVLTCMRKPIMTRTCDDLAARKPCKWKVRFFCRTMPAARNAGFLRHCFLAVQDENGKYISTISGQQDDVTRCITFADSAWDLDHLNKTPFNIEAFGDTDPREEPFNTGSLNACEFAECACKAAVKLNGAFLYFQMWQNSNTFISRVIRECKGGANFPGSAIGGPDVGNPRIPGNPSYDDISDPGKNPGWPQPGEPKL